MKNIIGELQTQKGQKQIPTAKTQAFHPYHSKMKQILYNPHRNDDDAKELFHHIKRNTFISRMLMEGEEVDYTGMLYLCKKLRWEEFKEGSVIIKQGDESNGKMYLVYQGELNVMTKSLDWYTKQNLQKISGKIQKEQAGLKLSKDLSSAEQRKEKHKALIKKHGIASLFTKVVADIINTPKKSTRKSPDSLNPSPLLDSGDHSPINGNPSSIDNIPQSTIHQNTNGSPPPVPHLSRFDPNATIQSHAQQSMPPLSSEKRDIAIPVLRRNSLIRSGSKTPELKRRSSRSKMSFKERQNSKIGTNKYPSYSDRFDVEMESLDPKLSNLASGVRKLGLRRSSANVSDVMKKNNLNEGENEEEEEEQDPITKYGVVKDTIKAGGFFGDRALISNDKRGATIMASTNVELLSLDQNTFKQTLSKFSTYKKSVIQFLDKFMPNLDKVGNSEIKDGFYYLTDHITAPFNSYLVNEQEFGQAFYLIYEGVCEVSRKVYIDETNDMDTDMQKLKDYYRQQATKSTSIKLLSISSGMFFGHEVLDDSTERYKYSVRVTSNQAKFVVFKLETFLARFPKDVIDEMANCGQQRMKTYDNKMIDLISQRKILIKSKDLNEVIIGKIPSKGTVKRYVDAETKGEIKKVQKIKKNYIRHQSPKEEHSNTSFPPINSNAASPQKQRPNDVIAHDIEQLPVDQALPLITEKSQLKDYLDNREDLRKKKAGLGNFTRSGKVTQEDKQFHGDPKDLPPFLAMKVKKGPPVVIRSKKAEYPNLNSWENIFDKIQKKLDIIGSKSKIEVEEMHGSKKELKIKLKRRKFDFGGSGSSAALDLEIAKEKRKSQMKNKANSKNKKPEIDIDCEEQSMQAAAMISADTQNSNSIRQGARHQSGFYNQGSASPSSIGGGQHHKNFLSKASKDFDGQYFIMDSTTSGNPYDKDSIKEQYTSNRGIGNSSGVFHSRDMSGSGVLQLPNDESTYLPSLRKLLHQKGKPSEFNMSSTRGQTDYSELQSINSPSSPKNQKSLQQAISESKESFLARKSVKVNSSRVFPPAATSKKTGSIDLNIPINQIKNKIKNPPSLQGTQLSPKAKNTKLRVASISKGYLSPRMDEMVLHSSTNRKLSRSGSRAL